MLINGIDRAKRKQEYADAGIDPHGSNDQFGTPFLYCGAHLSIHPAASQCSVTLMDKQALPAATTREEAFDEARALGLVIGSDPRPCVHCGTLLRPRGLGRYADETGETLCYPDKKRSPFHTPNDRF